MQTVYWAGGDPMLARHQNLVSAYACAQSGGQQIGSFRQPQTVLNQRVRSATDIIPILILEMESYGLSPRHRLADSLGLRLGIRQRGATVSDTLVGAVAGDLVLSVADAALLGGHLLDLYGDALVGDFDYSHTGVAQNFFVPRRLRWQESDRKTRSRLRGPLFY